MTGNWRTRMSLFMAHPELLGELIDDVESSMAEGAAAELARIKGVFEMAETMPGATTLRDLVAFETRGTAQDLAELMVAHESKARAAMQSVFGAAQLAVQGDPE